MLGSVLMVEQQKRKRPPPEQLRAFYRSLRLSDDVIDRAIEVDLSEADQPKEPKASND
jgi:hypothetical protein